MRELFFALGILCAAQPVLAADTNAVLNGWFAAQKDVRTWSADFTQTRRLKTLTQPLVTAGRLSFAAPNDFRWELGQPAQTIALRHESEMFLIYPRLKRAERYSLGAAAPREMRDAMSLLNAGFPNNRQEFEAQFQILQITETNGVWQLSLQPRSKFARQWMPELRLGLSSSNFSLTATELTFADGSSMRSDFTNAVMNPTLSTNLFVWKAPEDFKVTSPLSK